VGEIFVKEYINNRLSEIISKFPGVEIQVLRTNKYYITYFSGIEFDDLDETELKRKLDERFIVALESAVSHYRTHGIFWLIALAFTYFFGSIIRDLLIDVQGGWEGSIDYYFAYFIWILLCIFMPLIIGISYTISSGKLKNYLRILKIENLSQNNFIDDKKTSKIYTKKDRLTELEDLYRNKLITEEEFKKKRKIIIDDL
jgi:hypothetical protein